ncbi:hypothetical protein VCHA54P500_170006 [Vibrio chagasii]|nr:hypothetical protein VCHA48P439_140099 [Vibrio chagasii]CAH7031766.1 hypothetical protein VCHA54P500_170006 [Vibrio chagasii]
MSHKKNNFGERRKTTLVNEEVSFTTKPESANKSMLHVL